MDAPKSRLFLVTPPQARADAARACLDEATGAGDVATLLIADGPAQAALARALTGPAQAKGIAVLIEYDVSLAKSVGADGVMTGGSLASYKAARAALSAGAIVGARCASRHQTMELAEAGADFLAFASPDLIVWCQEVIEAPCVSLVPGVAAEFARPDDGMWRSAIDVP